MVANLSVKYLTFNVHLFKKWQRDKYMLLFSNAVSESCILMISVLNQWNLVVIWEGFIVAALKEFRTQWDRMGGGGVLVS